MKLMDLQVEDLEQRVVPGGIGLGLGIGIGVSVGGDASGTASNGTHNSG